MSFDWGGFLAIVARLFALSLIVQLALEALYRWTGFTVLEDVAKAKLRGVGLRFPVALAFSVWLVHELSYDVLSELFTLAEVHWSGKLVTAMAVTGGTAPFLALANQIEAWKERAKAVTIEAKASQAQTVRVDRVDAVVAKAAETDARADAGLPPAATRPADPSLTDGG